MKKADEILDDEALIDTAYEALRRRSAKRDTWLHENAGGNRDPTNSAQTRARLELRNTGTRSTRQHGLSGVHTDGRREGPGCEDHGPVGPSVRS